MFGVLKLTDSMPKGASVKKNYFCPRQKEFFSGTQQVFVRDPANFSPGPRKFLSRTQGSAVRQSGFFSRLEKYFSAREKVLLPCGKVLRVPDPVNFYPR